MSNETGAPYNIDMLSRLASNVRRRKQNATDKVLAIL